LLHSSEKTFAVAALCVGDVFGFVGLGGCEGEEAEGWEDCEELHFEEVAVVVGNPVCVRVWCRCVGGSWRPCGMVEKRCCVYGIGMYRKLEERDQGRFISESVFAKFGCMRVNFGDDYFDTEFRVAVFWTCTVVRIYKHQGLAECSLSVS
jgi:hypothetical protein